MIKIYPNSSDTHRDGLIKEEQKVDVYWNWEERQGIFLSPGEQPASRTCPPCGSCLGQKRTAAGNAGDPCPRGWTAGGRNDNSHCCRLWENPAIPDGQTHCLQLNTIEKCLTDWRNMLQKLVIVAHVDLSVWQKYSILSFLVATATFNIMLCR